MGENSKIEWTRHTFNPWIGCQKVGPGCDHCYAETLMDNRLGQVEWGPHGARKRTSVANWRKPLAWDRAAAAAGERHRVFCASLADVFDNHGSITSGWRGDLWHLIARTPHLDWMLLTKRPGNIRDMLPDGYGAPAWGDGWPNVWLGCTITSREEMLRDGPKLARLDARVRFWSVEPLLGDLGDVPSDLMPDLVIVGGESGPGARPMHPAWVRSLRDQCVAAGVSFFLKQWGEWSADALLFTDVEDRCPPPAMRIGKKAAGRLLDGRTWDQMPEGRADG